MHKGFDAVYDSDSRVLILGSFPSVKSRASGFYYANKQNRFWRTLSKTFDEVIDDDIEKKKLFLHKRHIALYDIVDESDLSGSADQTLLRSKMKVSDISFLLPPHTKVEKIICNGKASYSLVTMLNLDIPIIYLSSTSSANPRYDFEAWKGELEFLK